MREECRLRVFENIWAKRDKVTGSGENYVMRSFIISTPHPILFR
jgi:hypothetical protein